MAPRAPAQPPAQGPAWGAAWSAGERVQSLPSAAPRGLKLRLNLTARANERTHAGRDATRAAEPPERSAGIIKAERHPTLRNVRPR